MKTFEKCFPLKRDSMPRKASRHDGINHPVRSSEPTGQAHIHEVFRGWRKHKRHFVQNVEPDAGIGQKGAFFKGLEVTGSSQSHPAQTRSCPTILYQKPIAPRLYEACPPGLLPGQKTLWLSRRQYLSF